MPFPHNDIREFIDDLEKEGELIRVKREVDWDLEVGAIARRLCETTLGRRVKEGGQPAALFEKIKGYPEGFRICTMTHGGIQRIAMMLGTKEPDKATYRELQDLFLEGTAHPMRPNLVKSGPCKENIMMGEEVDLYKFPAPMVHEGDGGRYLCTFHVVATKDPESEWLNWGMYRAMIHDRRTLGGLIVPGQHGMMIYQKYEARNEPMPFAMAIFSDPLTLLVGACKVPAGVSEMDIIGGLRRQPLDVVKCETNDLLVPACSEIVIEGIVPPYKRLYEGPFGEYPGYVSSPRTEKLVYLIQAITYRNNPILGMSNMGMPVDDCHMIMTVSMSAILRETLIKNGLPVVDVNMIPECVDQLVIVSTKPYPGVAHMIASVIEATWRVVGANILVVNDDVDVFNPAEVMHAWTTRIHPERGIHIRRGISNPLLVWGSEEERWKFKIPGILYDATWPIDWRPGVVPRKSSFKTLYPQETQEKVLGNWTKYGFK